jgi:hypothetical protein
MNKFNDWDDILVLSRDIKEDDNLAIVMSRSKKESYHMKMEKIPEYLDKYFKENNYMLIYPVQDVKTEDGLYKFNNASLQYPIESFEDFTRSITGLLRKR